jgi:hypothetical protein
MKTKIDNFLRQYADVVILLGFGIGVVHIFGFLPSELEAAGIGDNVKFFYMGFIAVSAYTYYNFFWGKLSAPISYQRTVAPRKMSMPGYENELKRQFGLSTKQSKKTHIPDVKAPTPQKAQPSRQTFDRFQKEV